MDLLKRRLMFVKIVKNFSQPTLEEKDAVLSVLKKPKIKIKDHNHDTFSNH